MSNFQVLAFAGSLRTKSFNRALLEASKGLAPEGMTIEIFDLDAIPIYNMDLEPDFPDSVVAFKEAIKAADGLLIATPEHNFSFSGVLKNALDWASRPPSEGVLEGKPIALQSASPGWAGGVRSQLHLRQVLNFFSARQLYFPEVHVGAAHTKFDADMNLTDEMATTAITKQLAAFKDLISSTKA